MCAPLYKYDNGKVVVETKLEIKRRGHKSPNLADAFLLRFKVDHEVSPEKVPVKKLDMYRRTDQNRVGKNSWLVV